MGNKGVVRKLYISELLEGYEHDPIQTYPLVDSLKSKGIEICLSRYALCYGTDVRTASSCVPRAENIFDEVFESCVPEVGNIIPLLPLYPSSDYQLIQFESGLTLRYDSLPLAQRVELLTIISNQLYSLSWENGIWINDFLEISSVNSHRSGHRDLDTASASKWWKCRAISAKEKFQTDSTVLLDWEWICDSKTDTGCQTEVRRLLRNYSQDQFIVRVDSSSSCLAALNRPYHSKSLNRSMNCYASQLCGCSKRWDSCAQVALDSLSIRGGNYFVRDTLVFIGADVASAYKLCSNWWGTLGFKTSPSKDSLEIALGRLLTGRSNASIVWIGDKDSLPTIDSNYCSSYPLESCHSQPIYHIDLFFHPLGTLNGDTDFYYLFSNLEDSLHPETTKSSYRYKELQERLRRTAENIEDNLKSKMFNPKPILLPLGFYGDFANTEVFVAFANGISENKESEFCYYMPGYLNSEALRYSDYYSKAHEAAVHAMLINGLDVETIWANYDYNAALNCFTKVLDRID